MSKHSKRLVFLALAVGLAIAGGALYAANAQGDAPLYVADVKVQGVGTNGIGWGGPSGFQHWTGAVVLILGQDQQPVSGVTVRGRFTSCDEEYGASGRTNESGVATIRGERIVGFACLHDFTVTGVTKNGWSWDAPEPLPSAAGNCNCD